MKASYYLNIKRKESELETILFKDIVSVICSTDNNCVDINDNPDEITLQFSTTQTINHIPVLKLLTFGKDISWKLTIGDVQVDLKS